MPRPMLTPGPGRHDPPRLCIPRRSHRPPPPPAVTQFFGRCPARVHASVGRPAIILLFILAVARRASHATHFYCSSVRSFVLSRCLFLLLFLLLLLFFSPQYLCPGIYPHAADA
ncbi:hypothetical protein DENSPDRAFT_85666 [Dentipellis sp. KUC8613]|nr:hypothetical protein DENSPDRAFT_85666 [Dentipellis sp. KUC8613]